MTAVAGVAGSGKSTLGRALATALGAALLDLDSLTNPLLDSLPWDALEAHRALPSVAGALESVVPPGGAGAGGRSPSPGEAEGGGRWLRSVHSAVIRAGRYAALRAVARDVVGTAGCVVLVAPFTEELRGGEAWRLLREAVGDVRVVHLTGDEELFAARRAGRGTGRDRHRVGVVPEPPRVPVISVDAELTTDQQLLRVLAALGQRPPD